MIVHNKKIYYKISFGSIFLLYSIITRIGTFHLFQFGYLFVVFSNLINFNILYIYHIKLINESFIYIE